jgi:hypothetical protein
MRIAVNSKLYVYAYDDALNAGDLVVDGGRLFAYSVTNDAVDSNGTITVNGGLVIADGSFSPEQGIDTDFPDKFRVTGGTLFSVGGTMGPSPCLPMADGTSVPAVSCSGLELKKGCFLSLVDEKGRSLYSYRLQRDMTDGGVLVVSGKLPSRGDCAFVLSDSIDGGIYVANGISENAVPAGVDRSVAFAIGGNVTAVSRDGGVIDVEKFMMNMPSPPPPHGAMSPGDSMPVPPGFPAGMIPPGDSVPVHPGMFPHRKMPFPPPARLEVKSEYGIGNLPNHK